MRFAIVSRLAAAVLLGALFASPAVAADVPHVISVSGQGEISGVPDQAQLSAGVATVAASANAALAQNASKMTAVFDALKRLGVPDKAIRTSNFSVQPQYADTPNGARQRITGYLVSNQVDVTLDDTRKLGPALDALVGAGANEIKSVSFAIRDANALLEMARKAAIADARKRAETYTTAAGVSLGSVVSISENGGGETRPMGGIMAYAGRAAPTPTAAGEQSVTASVTVVFELK